MVESIFSKVLDCQGTTLKIDSNNEGISRQISNSLEHLRTTASGSCCQC